MHPRLMEALTKENPQSIAKTDHHHQQQTLNTTHIKEKQLNSNDLCKVTSSSSLQPNAKRIRSILNETTSTGSTSNRIKLESNDAEKLIRLIKQNNSTNSNNINNNNNNNNTNNLTTNVNSNVVFSPRLAFLTKINSSTALPLATHNENTSNTINHNTNNNNITTAITQIQNQKQSSQQQQNENQQKISNQNIKNLLNVKFNESKTISVRVCPAQQPATYFKAETNLPCINESLKLLSPSQTPTSTPTTPNFPQSLACIDESPGIKPESKPELKPEPEPKPEPTPASVPLKPLPTITRSTRISLKTNSNQNANNEYSSSLTTSSSKRQKISNNQPTIASSPTPQLQPTTQAPNTTRKPFACLRNLGSTCYINCIIQVMRYTPGFVLSIHRLNKQIDYLKTLNCDIENEIDRNSDITFVRNLHELLVEMSEKEKLDRRPIYTPRKFVNTVWSSLSFWSDGSQQDAHEFLQYTIHFINECDLFIRKLQQKYQLKNLPLMWDSQTSTNSTASTKTTTTTTITVTCDTQQDKFKKPTSLSSNNKIKYKSASNLTDININIINEEDSSSSTSSTSSSSSSSSSSGTMCSLRLIKSVPKIHDGTSSAPIVNDYMRTPTKGGASVNTNATSIIDDNTNQPDPVLKPQAAGGREPIKVKLQLDTKSGAENSYKVVSLTGLSDTSDLGDKDLVSKLLKSVTNTSATTNLNVNKSSKRVRKPDEVKCQPSQLLQTNDLDDDSSVIIIDSTDDEDDYVQVETPATPVTEKPEPPPNIEVAAEQQPLTEPFIDQQLEMKKCYVLLERIDVEKLKTQHITPQQTIINNNNNNNPETKKRIRPKNVKFRSKSKTFPPPLISTTSPSPTPSPTPTPTPTPTLTTTNEIFDLDSITPLSSLTDSCAVTSGTGSSSCTRQTKNTRSSNVKATTAKVMANVNNPIVCEPAKAVQAVLPSDTPPATTLPGSTSAPPSPAELLRKYSTSVGYVCEMDKLFKGSSVTVTQCLECENLRKCPEAFYDRSIPIRAGPDDQEDGGWISKCLSNESYLNENSKYMCDICSSKQEARIHTQYTQMPNILVLHLLSYGITSSLDGNLNAQKISNRSRLVNYFDFLVSKETPMGERATIGAEKDVQSAFKSPITTRRQTQLQQQQQQINQQSTSVDPTYKHQFKLFAVVMHSGVSLNSGHYTAFINYRIVSQRENNIDSFKKLNLKNEKPCSCLVDCKMDDLPSSTTPTATHSTTSNTSTSRQNKFNYPTVASCNLPNESSTTSQKNVADSNQPEWLHFDDTKVKSMSSLEFHRKIIDSSYDSPYILFYVKD